MTVRKLTIAILFSVVSFALSAQDAAPAPYRSFTPKDQWELGLDVGVPLVVGDIDTKPGFGGGLHVRKALDHVFSIRVNGLYAQGKNENAEGPTTTSDLNWISGDVQLVVALNNMRFDKPVRKVLLNGFAGVGVNSFSTDYVGVLQAGQANVTSGTSETTTNLFVNGGLGIAFRVSPKFNIGIENTTYVVFGAQSDLLDSDQNVRTSDQNSVTTYRDLVHFPHLSLNFNLGGKNKDGSMKSEPLYWANPLSQVADAITALEARPIYDPTDTDADGIIDAIDEEDSSPAGARVDTKGVSLDSDGDKVLDYNDKEPYSPPGYRVDGMGVAQVPKPISEADVNRIVDAKIAAIKFPEPGGMWFLPMVTFADNRYDLRYSEFEKLYQVATVLKLNPAVKVVVIGGADKRGSEQYNNVLSYNRANAAIDFLVNQHGIARERLILNWVGEGTSLIPEEGSIMQNRRVEFRVAKGETEMARPEGPDAGKTKKVGSYKGNKDAGY